MTLVEMPQEAELDDDVDLSSMSLDELAAQANAEHESATKAYDQALAHLNDTLRHAIMSGHALKAARLRLADQGDWLSWLEANTSISPQTAKRYIRFASYERELLTADVPLSTYTAIEYLKGLPRCVQPPGRLAPETISQIKTLYAKGVTPPEIGRMLGVSESGVRDHVIPGERAKRQAYWQKKKRERKAAAKALAEKERAESIRKAGGNISAAYSYVRKAAAELDAAIGDATTPEVRLALRAALAGVHKAEDEIGKAVRHG